MDLQKTKKMENKQKQQDVKLFCFEDIFKDSISSRKPRNYEEDSLHELLCKRYALSRYAYKEKLIELVTQELSL